MSTHTLYIGNATDQDFTFCYRPGNQYPQSPGGTGGPALIDVPAGTVASRAFDGDTGAQFVADQFAPYYGAWSGSGIGWQIDTPITL